MCCSTLPCGAEATLDSLDTIRRRIPNARFVVTPTVIEELSFWALPGNEAGKQTAARTALASLRNRWQMDPVNLVPVGHGIVERIAARLRESGLLPVEEVHDSLLLAEAALLGCAIMLTGDAHLRGMDYPKALLELKECDVEMPVIGTPREIVSKFF